MRCPKEEELDRYIHGELDNGRAKRLAEHVKQCLSCQSQLREVEAKAQLIDRVRADFPQGLRPFATGLASSGRVGSDMFFLSGSGVQHERLEIPEGYLLNQRYEIVKELGRGGQTVVYLAKDIHLGASVALKTVKASSKGAIDRVEQLRQEWQHRENITDFAHITKAYPPEPSNYQGVPLVLLPMEPASASLHDWLNRHFEDVDTRLDLGLELLIQACEGVKVLHGAGQAHLDIKPENILLFETGTLMIAKITDFGISQSLKHLSGQTPSPVACRCTPEYASPEQINFSKSREIGMESDIYSLGVVLFELLTGHVPFRGQPLEIFDQHLHAPPPKLTRDLRPWEKIIERCMKKDRKDRYPNVDEFIRELKRVRSKFSLAVDIACPTCDHINSDPTLT